MPRYQFFKKLRLSSFRSKAIFSFLAFLGSLTVWIGSYFYIHRKDTAAEKISISILDVSKQFNASVNNYNTFIYTDYRDPDFYNKSEATSLYLYLSNLRSMPEQLKKMELEASDVRIPIALDSIINHFKELRREVLTLVTKMERRGYKNFGIEGRMQEKAQLLTTHPSIDKISILELRTLEKDFLLRGDIQYFNDFNYLSNQLLENNTLKDSTRILLRGYLEDFRSFVALNNEIGHYSEVGLHKKIKSIHSIIHKDLSDISTVTNKEIESKKITQFITTSIISVLLAFILVLLILFLSKNLTKGVKTLNENITQFISSDFEDSQEIHYDHTILEIESLFASYQKLKETLIQNIKDLEITAKIATDNANYKTQFLSKMSHEMRTPLNGIQGMLQLLKSETLEEEQGDQIKIAERSAGQLSDLIAMILDHSKLETGTLRIEEKSVNLEDDIALLMRIFEYQAKDKNLDFEYINQGNTTYKVYIDTLRIQQILINLMKNAIKFTQVGKITILVEEGLITDEKQHLRFIVSDTGIGMDENDFERLLESFEQADNSKNRKFDGAGLGLSLSNRLLELMGSKLQVESKLGVGTTFYFDLALRKAEYKIRTDVTKKIDVAISNNPENTHALIVEDNLINQKVIEKLLSKLNITCDLAINGKIGVELFKKNTYDLILMDINMPIMDGIEATRLIKSLDKYTIQKPPVIAVTTGTSKQDDASFIKNNGLDEFLGKPIDFDTLKSIIQKYR
ncbi:ATP-binding protein [Dokdonia sp.]|uniref:ATP-binding protein n=1 Tax=Dokdonia sp. TaxID=2024995 RepID=UPI003262DC16